ncbi:hypothetical protein K470DRAFT_265546 [Piedraia hortae CBS 480.64]|uniref:WD40 repeat-like protein n=1 Tax=Piedraia hortae CBS 480.64 TaxID=1314780 RepID=A0A6A7BVN6_9PEZI|nr:hypothetical protein K470DRAFT_265546 [Piedraia hortae CBS 480.64]
MISASESPPVSYLHDLENNISRQIKPQASTTAVCVAAFHPRRAHSFLLGFKDGTLAGYNARKVKGERGDGEVSHLKRLHQSTAAGGGTVAGAVFLEGHKSRAVSISADGRCRLVDFADGGVVLRSWHAQGELTCVAVFDGLIAVGRRDGQVQVYDEVGILKATRSVAEEKIIGVEWVSGEEYAAEMQEERGFVSALGSYPSLTSPEDVREADPPQDKFLSLFSPLKAVEDEPPPPVPLRIRPLRQGMSTEAQPPVKRMVDPSPRKFAMLRTPKRSALPKNSSNAERNAKLLADLRRLNPREKKGTLALYSSDSQRLAPVTKEDESPDKEGPMDIWLTEPSSGSESERPKREKVRKSRFAERFSTLNSEDPKMSSPAKSTLKGDEESDYKTASPGKSLVGEEASGEKESSEESGKTVVRTHIESIGTCVRAKYDGNDSTESVYQKDGEYRVQCADCIKTKDEIARLKGEIMALRAVMRRHGIVTSDYRK